MKRVLLLVATNFAVLLLLSVVASVLGIDRVLTENGINFSALLIFSALFGFGGAFISLLISKPMAKWSVGARVIDGTEGSTEYWLVETVRKLAQKSGIGMPEVAVFDGEANAFATGAFRDSALVAVSTGLVQSMSRDEVEAVLGHEIAHVANGDMVTLTLIQGVVNTFVIFLSRIIGYVVDRVLLKNDRGQGIGFYATVFIAQILLGFFASMIVAWFSRQREFRADAGSAELMGTARPMVAALSRLGGLQHADLPQQLKAFGIASSGLMALFSTHPPIEQRIAALQARATRTPGQV